MVTQLERWANSSGPDAWAFMQANKDGDCWTHKMVVFDNGEQLFDGIQSWVGFDLGDQVNVWVFVPKFWEYAW